MTVFVTYRINQCVKNIRLKAWTDNNPVGSEGAVSLKNFLKQLPNLEELRYSYIVVIFFNDFDLHFHNNRLYGNKLQSSQFMILSPVIARMKYLKKLM